MSMIDSIMATAEDHLERLNARRRETVPAATLVVGVQCGGSDALLAASPPIRRSASAPTCWCAPARR